MEARWQKYSAKSLWANQLWTDCVMSHVMTNIQKDKEETYTITCSLYFSNWRGNTDIKGRWRNKNNRPFWDMGLAKDVEDTLKPARSGDLCERRILEYSILLMWPRGKSKILKDIFLGKAPGETGRGRSPFRWSDISEARMSSVVRAASQAQDCDRWRALLGTILL